MRFLFSKYAIWMYSLIFFLFIGVVLDIATICAEEFALFDNSMKATTEAKMLRYIHSFYFPTIIVGHLLMLIIFGFKKSN